jgi:hypothetical protein
VSRLTKGVTLALIQLLLVASLGAKLLYDRTTQPRGWAKVQTYDPDLPIRGRYLWEQLSMPAEGFTFHEMTNQEPTFRWDYTQQWAYYTIRDGQLIASSTGAPSQSGGWVNVQKNADGSLLARSESAVFFFIPDTANISPLQRGDEMWMEVTLPKKGPPRPIRMALKHGGRFTPLNF